LALAELSKLLSTVIQAFHVGVLLLPARNAPGWSLLLQPSEW
jgi:hypothetical protein